MSKEIIAALEGVRFAYDGRAAQPVLPGLDLEIRRGEILTLVGPNGCGKTTLLKLLGHLLTPDAGQICIEGKPLASYERKELARLVSSLPQNRPTPDIPVQALVSHGRFPYLDLSRKLTTADSARVEHAIEAAQVAPLRQKSVAHLSGGERQRAYLAMLIAQDTELLLLDEPVTYLDPRHQFGVMELVRELQAAGKTVVLVLHDLRLALSYSSRIAVMEAGQLRCIGTPAEVLADGQMEAVFGVRCVAVEVGGVPQYIVMKKDGEG